MRLSNRKGIELSLNFIVMLIITLIVFGATLTIAFKVMNKTNNLKASMDSQTQASLESMMTSGNDEVAIAFNKKDASPGEPVTFGIGVLNTLGSTKTFTVTLSPSTAIKKDGSEDTSFKTKAASNGWIFLQSDTIGVIKNNAYMIKSIVIIPPKSGSGVITGTTYVFDVKVTHDSNQAYPLGDPIKKIRVTIV